DTVPVGDGSSYTIEIGNKNITHPPKTSGAPTTEQYLLWLIEDARKQNPGIKLLTTLNWGDGQTISRIFSVGNTPEESAAAFAKNLLAYYDHYGLDGLDIDWEYPLSNETSTQQLNLLLNAVQTEYKAHAPKQYFLTLSPVTADNLDGETVNSTVDFLNLQLYGGTSPSEYTQSPYNINAGLLAYGAKFESNSSGDLSPYQDAQNAYQGYVGGDYNVITQWRLNSGNFPFEQAQQMILYQLVYGIPSNIFDDSPIIGAAANAPVSHLVIRSGDVLDAIQATNAAEVLNIPVTYQLLQHGGNGGSTTEITIPQGDALAEISGFTGTWFGWNCVLQITVKTRNGKSFGPFGTMHNSSSQSPFAYTAPAGQSIVAFSGSVVNVPLAGGGTTDIIQSLNVTFA
ncbi:MAG: glycosyl hydrolase family 18 protein, partial [Methylobacter sp.]